MRVENKRPVLYTRPSQSDSTSVNENRLSFVVFKSNVRDKLDCRDCEVGLMNQ